MLLEVQDWVGVERRREDCWAVDDDVHFSHFDDIFSSGVLPERTYAYILVHDTSSA